MAIAFARISYHSRSQGHSAVAGAAYRAGNLLLDERTGEVHNFQNRRDVVYSKLLLPAGADNTFQDRAVLWNAVEAVENRSNSQVAKDVILALPRDLDLSHQIDLANNFANYHFVRHGIVADVAIHDSGDGNPHAHLYVTTRRLQGNRFDKYKARDLEPDVVRGRVVDPQYWGEQWRAFQNNYFQTHGLDLVVDANYLLSQRHEGRIRRHAPHYLKEENRLRREASIEIALHDPESVLNTLGHHYAVFSERDMALLIDKNTDTREAYETALLNLKAHRDLILLGPGDDGRDRYTTRANYLREALMADHADALNARHQHKVNRTLVDQAVRDFGLNTEQVDALSHIANSGDVCAVVGRAGTGKSYLMKAARQMWEAAGFTVRGMAVSGIASKGLEADSGIRSTTIHSLKMQMAFGLALGPNDVLVMDEAGMTDLNDLAFMVDAAKTAGAKLVLVGDHAQLQPVGPGAPFRAIVELIGFAELNQIQRQNEPGDCAASVLLSRGEVGQAVDYYATKQHIHLVDVEDSKEAEDDDGGSSSGTRGGAIARLVMHWSQELTTENIHKRLILAHQHIDVRDLNRTARQAMREQGLLGHVAHSVNAIDGPIELSVGDRILFLRNNRQLGLSNGEFATVLNVEGNTITVRAGKQQTRKITFSTKDYADFNYGYAATVHKSQGATFDHTFVYVAGRAWDRFLSYVAMTRHRKTLHVYADKEQFNDLAALKATLSRSRLKDSVLDWPLSYAIRRGFDPESLIGWFIDQVAGVKQFIRDKWLFVTNYAAFTASRAYQQSQRTRSEQREMAKKVALFVDLRNGLSSQAQMMRQDLKSGEQFHRHHDYSNWFEQTLLKNRLAFEIKQEYPLFEKALALNRVNPDTLNKLALDHERALHVKAYFEYYQKGQRVHCYRLAAKIQPEINKYFSTIAYQARLANVSQKALISQLQADDVQYRRLMQLKNLNATEKDDFRRVDRYVHIDRDIKATLSRAYILGGFDQLSKRDIKILSAQKASLDRLSVEIVKQPSRFSKALAFYDIDEDRLADGYERHLLRNQVKTLDDSMLSLSARDALCAKILSDKRYYPLISEQSLDWQNLRERRDVHHHRETLRALTSGQRHYYRLVNDYQRARIDAGIAWSELFKEKESKIFIPEARWQFAIALSRTRDRLAHTIVINAQECMRFITPTLLKLSDIEKHAVNYNHYLAMLKNNRAKERTNKKHSRKSASIAVSTRDRSNHLDYQVINEALIQLGEAFYIRVLGDNYKRAGNHLRFGRKGSLNVTLSGSHAGSWHSFETDEGGGPIQLLMDPTHGWGLSFREALQEGVRLSGLSVDVLRISDIPAPKNSVIKATDVEDKSEKIARARYYYQSAEPISGTIGERYLREHRRLKGDLKAFRFHPSIRDDWTDKESRNQVSYHPGIVVAAKNYLGEITAVQTILLDPNTAHKVNEQSVGAVKRTRGDLKDSSVPIHLGDSNKVIIAEGPETAASLIEAEPDANIYVTLGNIKNAAHLGWLSKKHKTNIFYFAADNDGPHAKNIQALQEVAGTLKEKYQIQSYIVIPTLPDHEKCDFNDVLKEKGIDEVKQQLNHYRPISVKAPEKCQIIPEHEIHERLESSVDEWERLKSIKSHAVERVLLAKSRLDKANKPITIEIQTRGYENAVKQLLGQGKIFSKVKAVAPGLAHTFATISSPSQAIKVDWLSETYAQEFKALEKSDNKDHKMMITLYQLLKANKGKPKESMIVTQLESLGIKAIKYQNTQVLLQSFAPKLAAKFSEISLSKSKRKYKGQ